MNWSNVMGLYRDIILLHVSPLTAWWNFVQLLTKPSWVGDGKGGLEAVGEALDVSEDVEASDVGVAVIDSIGASTQTERPTLSPLQSFFTPGF